MSNLKARGTPLIIFLFVLLLVIPNIALAHNPQNMELEYDFFNQKLNITITHDVTDPNTHYIERVDIKKNDILYFTENFTSQPSTSTFTYTYDVGAEDGDELEVTATSSGTGFITGQITVNEPSSDDIVVTIDPQLSAINENTGQEFLMSISAGGEPLDDLALTIDVKLGAISSHQKVSTGQYSFNYTAPDVTKDLIETIDIGVKKEGYNDGTLALTFTVREEEDTGGSCPPTLDGVIDSGEYDFTASFSDGDFKLHWKVTGDTILVAMEAKTSGWVAIGIEPSSYMKDADMIFGWVTDSGTVVVRDCFSTGAFGPHPPDTEIGGTSDILCFGGQENAGKTIIEFKRLLSTGDERDNTISTTSDIKLIWALGSSDDFEEQHTQRGAGTVNFGEGTYSEIDTVFPWILHAALMIIGYSMMLIGMIIARFFKKKKWWLKRHKLLGILGAVLSVAGLVMALIMVSLSSGEHFRVPHAFVGVIAIIFAVMTPTLGIAQFKVKKNKAKIRTFHRWFGRITLVVMFINILIGLTLV